MAKYTVMITRRLELTCEISLSAKDDDALEEKLEAMQEEGKMGELEWAVVGGRKKDEWEENENEVEWEYNEE